jgi:hypothetical protein
VWGNGDDHAWLSPVAAQSAIADQYRYFCEVEIICEPIPWPLGDATPYVHLVYLAALCGVLAGVALLRRSRSRSVLLLGGGSLAVAAGLGVALVA